MPSGAPRHQRILGSPTCFCSGAIQQAAIIYGYTEVMARNEVGPDAGYREASYKEGYVGNQAEQRPQTLDALFADKEAAEDEDDDPASISW